MARSYLLFVIAGGVVASMLGNGEAPTSDGPETMQRSSDQESGSAAPESGSSWSSSNGSEIQIERSGDGHFYADVRLNNVPVRMLVDTGATAIALSRDDARSAGIATSIGMNDVVGEGASGAVHGEYVTLESVSLGNVEARSMDAVVLKGGGQSLLGQSFLSKFDSVEIKDDRMTLR